MAAAPATAAPAPPPGTLPPPPARPLLSHARGGGRHESRVCCCPAGSRACRWRRQRRWGAGGAAAAARRRHPAPPLLRRVGGRWREGVDCPLPPSAAGGDGRATIHPPAPAHRPRRWRGPPLTPPPTACPRPPSPPPVIWPPRQSSVGAPPRFGPHPTVTALPPPPLPLSPSPRCRSRPTLSRAAGCAVACHRRRLPCLAAAHLPWWLAGATPSELSSPPSHRLRPPPPFPPFWSLLPP